MNLFRFAIRNIEGSGTRSLTVFLCVLGVTVFFSATTLIVTGAELSLQRGLKRLGADILVVPEGAEQKIETALLMGKPTEVWMSTDYVEEVRAVPGVAAVSPQVYLQSLYGASCCAVSEMFIVVFDPETDFAVTPWLASNLGRPLQTGEVIGGSYIFTPPGEKYIKLYGYDLTLRGNLEPTGTGLDQTMFITMDTARDVARSSIQTAERPLLIPAGLVSSLMVKVEPGADPHQVALQLLLDVMGVTPIESPDLFGSFRRQMLGLLWGFLALLAMAWLLSAVLMGLVFSMAANERRRQMAVLRALGARRLYVFRSLLVEAVGLAMAGGVLGLALGSSLIFIFRNYIAGSMHMPFLFPAGGSLLGLVGLGLGLSLLSASLAAFYPALRMSREEPALAMRE